MATKKNDWIAFYAEENGMTKGNAEIEIKRFEETFRNAFIQGYLPSLHGVFFSKIGNIHMKEVKNPATGEVIARDLDVQKITFSPSQAIKDIVKNTEYDLD